MWLVIGCAGGVNAAALSQKQQAAVRDWIKDSSRGDVVSLKLPAQLSKAKAALAHKQIWRAYQQTMSAQGPGVLGDLPPTVSHLREHVKDGKPSMKSRILQVGEHVMPFTLVRREKPPPPKDGRPLFICMHGGGQNGKAKGPHAWNVNTREWRVQTQLALRLYEPQGLYFVPRMADDRLGRWWHWHNQDAFEQVIRHGVLFWNVDPNRVYLLGISEGGYGSDILAPFMPDLFAGANPIAAGVGLGNPLENLRNLPFRTEVGEKDTMFDRVGLARGFHERLDQLHAQDAEGYNHVLNVQPGRGHGVDYKPGVAWIAQFQRNPYPDKIVWTNQPLDHRRRSRMYWVELIGDSFKGAIRLTAELDKPANAVKLTAHQLIEQADQGHPTHTAEQQENAQPLTGATLNVLLNDQMLNLDRPVRILCNGREVFAGKVQRDAGVLLETLMQRGEPFGAFPVRIPIVLE